MDDAANRATDRRLTDDEVVIDLRGRQEAVAPSDTRDRLVQAAAEIFREKGFTGSRVQDIARRAGFTSGALYSYFDSRAALLAEAITVENDRLLRDMSDGLGRVDLPVTAEIAAALSQFAGLEFSPTDQLLLDGLAICAREPDARQRIGDAIRHFATQLEGRLERTPSLDGSHLSDDPAAVSFLMVVFLAGVTAVRAAGLQDLAPDRLQSMLAGMLGALGARDALDAPAVLDAPSLLDTAPPVLDELA